MISLEQSLSPNFSVQPVSLRHFGICFFFHSNLFQIKNSSFLKDIFENTTQQTYQTVCKMLESKDLPEKRICFRIEYQNKDDLGHLFTLMKAKVQGLITGLLRINSKADFRLYTSLFDSTESSCRFYIGINDDLHLSTTERQILIDSCNQFIATVKSMSYCANYDLILECQSI